MHVTKAKHVWRTKNVTTCDICRNGKKIATREYPAAAGMARIFNLAVKEFGEDISIQRPMQVSKVYVMPLDEFYSSAKCFDSKEID